jgi:Rap1a immunity proteins
MKAIIGLALTALMATMAWAAEDFTSTNYMLPECRHVLDRLGHDGFDRQGSIPSDGPFGGGYCMGQIHGFAFMLQRNPGPLWCALIPKGVTEGQMLMVVVRYIEARPNRMHESFDLLTAEALVDAWPCKK